MDKPRINWKLIWDKGPVAVFMAPSAFPVGVWFYESVLPKQLRTDMPLLDIASGVVAVLAGFAIDIGIVRIATGMPTNEKRYLSWTTWVPIIVWLMGCTILYDWYSQGLWEWNMSTFTHLAFPTISLVMALYWSFSHGYEDAVRKPVQEKLTNAQQLIKWLKVEINRVAQELISQKQEAEAAINQLRADLRAELSKLAHELNQAQAELTQALNDQLGSTDKIDQLTQQLIDKDDEHERLIYHLRMSHANEIQELINTGIELKRKLELEKMARESAEARTPADLSGGQKAAIREMLAEGISNDEILAKLNIDMGDRKAVQSARSQISQVKRELGMTAQAA